MISRRGWTGISCALFGAAVLALAACGDGDDDGGGRSLRILVTNDDGVAAAGIDAVVAALVADARNEVVVCAPSGNRSGSGDMTGPSERYGDLSAAAAATLGGYAATALDGCPADTVNYALAELYPPDAPPDVVISGINEGQNVSELVATQLSGTVGAAKTAARNGVPALAASQGVPQTGAGFDYPAGVAAVLAWLDDNRDALLAGGAPPTMVDNINVPSCATGAIRGTIVGLPLAASAEGALAAQDCTSTLADPGDDVEALNNGFVAQSAVPLD